MDSGFAMPAHGSTREFPRSQIRRISGENQQIQPALIFLKNRSVSVDDFAEKSAKIALKLGISGLRVFIDDEFLTPCVPAFPGNAIICVQGV
jgi:hypothetical protein